MKRESTAAQSRDHAACMTASAWVADLLLTGTIQSLQQAGWDGELIPEPGYSPPPRLLREVGGMAPAEIVGPATSLPLEARRRDRRGSSR